MSIKAFRYRIKDNTLSSWEFKKNVGDWQLLKPSQELEDTTPMRHMVRLLADLDVDSIQLSETKTNDGATIFEYVPF